MPKNPFAPDPAHMLEERLQEVRTRAENIAIGVGGVDYLSEMSKTISAAFIDRKVPREFSVLKLNGHVGHVQTRIWTPKGKRRSISRNMLKQRFPHAFNAAVTVVPPEHPYHVRLDAPGREKSKHWAALKAAGAANWEMSLRERFGTHDWAADEAMRHLYGVRQFRKRLEETVDRQKAELILFITDNELPLTVKVQDDGQVGLRENQPKYTVDYALLERCYPAAAKLITTTPLSDTPRIVMREIELGGAAGDEDELDEDGYNEGFWD